MSSFPPKTWHVRHLSDMDSIVGDPRPDRSISMETYLAVQPSGGEEGAFRFTLAGPRHLEARIQVTTILPDKRFDNMWLTLQLELGTQIKIEKNSVASKWMDIVEMVNAQDADITDHEGEEVNERFLEAINEIKETAPMERSGIVLRWLLGAFGESKEIFLIAQALPCNMEVIEANPSLRSDHTRGVMAAKFPVQYEAFDDAIASGKRKTKES